MILSFLTEQGTMSQIISRPHPLVPDPLRTQMKDHLSLSLLSYVASRPRAIRAICISYPLSSSYLQRPLTWTEEGEGTERGEGDLAEVNPVADDGGGAVLVF